MASSGILSGVGIAARIGELAEDFLKDTSDKKPDKDKVAHDGPLDEGWRLTASARFAATASRVLSRIAPVVFPALGSLERVRHSQEHTGKA